MSREAHVVYIRCRNHVFGHGDRIIPETEIINAVGALGYGKERFAVSALHTHHQQVLAVPFDGTRVHGRIHTDTFH